MGILRVLEVADAYKKDKIKVMDEILKVLFPNALSIDNQRIYYIIKVELIGSCITSEILKSLEKNGFEFHSVDRMGVR